MAEAFEKLTEGLTDSRKAEFLKTLYEAGISQRDLELGKLLRALQIYKAYYETIPESIRQAVSEISLLKDEMAKLTGQAEQSVDAGGQLFERLIHETAQVDESLRQLHAHVEDSVDKASDIVSQRMSELLSNAMQETLPLSDLAEAGKVFSEALAASNQASAELRANVRNIRRAHWRAYALAACSVIAVFWIGIHYLYRQQLEQERVAVIAQIEGNRDVLLELARSNRNLELIYDEKDPELKLLSMKDATGWTSTGKRGVIEFRD